MTEARPWQDRPIVPALVVGLVALGIRIHGLGRAPFWADEFHVVLGEPGGIVQGIQTAAADVYPPLHYVLAALIHDATGVRALSAVAGALAVFLTTATASRLAGTRAGAMGGLWLAFLPADIFWSHEARAYALLGLWCAAIAFVLTTPRVHAVVAGLLAAAVMYTHGLGVVYLGGFVVASLLVGRRDVALAIAAGAATFVPWVPVAMQQAGRYSSWNGEGAPSTAVVEVLRDLGIGHVDSPWWALTAIPVLALVGLSTREAGPGRAIGAAVAVAAAPILVFDVAVHGLMAKYLLPLFPLVAVLVAIGVGQVRRWEWLAGVALVAMPLFGLLHGLQYEPRHFNLRGAVEATEAAREAGPISALAAPEWSYYAPNEWVSPLPVASAAQWSYYSWQREAFAGRSPVVWWWMQQDAAGPKDHLDPRLPIVWSANAGGAWAYALSTSPGEAIDATSIALEGAEAEENGRIAFYRPSSARFRSTQDGELVLWGTGSTLGAREPVVRVDVGAASTSIVLRPRLQRLDMGPIHVGDEVALRFIDDASGPDGDLNAWIHRLEVVQRGDGSR